MKNNFVQILLWVALISVIIYVIYRVRKYNNISRPNDLIKDGNGNIITDITTDENGNTYGYVNGQEVGLVSK